MVQYETLIQIGEKLKRSDINYITTKNLFILLRKATKTQTNKSIRHYAKILKSEGYIQFNQDGRWEINH